MKHSVSPGALLASLLLLLLSAAPARSATLPFEEYSKRIKSATEVSPLASELFGEQVSLYNGATEFRATDISIPGNNGLPVALSRRLRIESRAEFAQAFGGFGSWDLDVPYIQGAYLDNWGSSSAPSGRCSGFAAPPNYGEIKTKDYWSGVRLNLPGQGAQDILRIGSPSGLFPKMQAPADGQTYRLGTKEFHRIRCKAATANGFGGEGFIVLTPDGTTMTFDVGVTRNGGTIGKPISQGNYASANRTDVYLLVSSIVDRHGNSVTYAWNGDKLQSITGSDGRSIALTWSGNAIASATANGRTWTYQYDTGTLSRVTLPDGSAWAYDTLNAPGRIVYPFGTGVDASDPGCSEAAEGTASGWLSITHPSGAQGRFDFQAIRHRRTGVPSSACYQTYSDPYGIELSRYELGIPDYFDTLSLVSRQVTGPGLPSAAWSYVYEVPVEGRTDFSYAFPCATCQKEKGVRVTGPDGTITEYRFGTLYEGNDGLLLGTYKRSANNTILRAERNAYVTPAEAQSMPFPEVYGYNPGGDDGSSVRIRPVKATTLAQDGAITQTAEGFTTTNAAVFNRASSAFDAFGRPLAVTKSSSLGYSKAETTEYHDVLAGWILGQVTRSTVDGIETGRTEFHANALPWKSYAFGKLQQTLTYNADGTVATVKDGNNNVTTLSSWHRGIPRAIAYADGTSTSALVNDNGWVTAVTDENGYATGYGYDAMGRVASMVYPTGDAVNWQNVTLTFQKIPYADRGLPAGHWRSTRSEGNRVTTTVYDGMWRPVMKVDRDAALNLETQGITRYDINGRVAFQAYPTRNASDFNQTLSGTWTTYDGLDRPIQVAQDWEGSGQLTTTTEYLTGFQTRVTNPRGFQSTTGYYAYDAPGYDAPAWVVKDAGGGNDQTIQIQRDAFGKPKQIRQSGSTGGVLADVSRHYVYDTHQQLCKTVEPETGATVMDYDNAGNLSWQAAGMQGYAGLGDCDRVAGLGSGRAVHRTYDLRNRLKTLVFPDGRGNQAWSYAPDGLPSQIVTDNDGPGLGTVINAYAYNKRRLLSGQGESINQPNWYTWGIGYGYTANGQLANHSYPTGLVVSYAPNALGQATAVTGNDGRTYASGVQYTPNGAISQFAYGNGIVHTMTQNARQLPLQVASGTISGYQYGYDENGNPTQLHDLVQGGNYSRLNQYDGLDRLTASGSVSYGGGHWHNFTYDALDNLKSWKLAGVKDYANYVYDTSNRLTLIQNTAGAGIVGLGYDPQGNLSNRNGQGYTFDYGNRLRGVPNKETYRYDGLGRRVLSWRQAGNTVMLSQYSQSGQLMYSENTGTLIRNEHVYLGGSLLATREHQNWTSGPLVVKYQHTDALGSPVAVTNEAGAVIDRTQWEPYGAAIGKPAYDGIGYTGHVMDGATGLTYMQQRYYDQQIGRFLSVDPVTAYSSPGSNFNRYWYANNNPHKFTDPDGRIIRSLNEKNNELLEKSINALAAGKYKFDKNNNLQQVEKPGKDDKGSQYYADKINSAIESKHTININVSDSYKDARDGREIRVEGGLTQGLRAGKSDQNVVVTGRSYTGNIKDVRGRSLTEKPRFVLAHELVGHAIPQMIGSSSGNAVQNENRIRDEVGAPLRQEESWHTE